MFPKLTKFFFVFFTGFGADLGPNTDPKIHRKYINEKDQKLHCIKRTEIEVEKRNVEGLSFGLKLESLCTNKRKG